MNGNGFCHLHHPAADRRSLGLGLFHSLPDELICSILELLGAKDLGMLSCASSAFYIFCNEDPLWMKLCLQNHKGLIKFLGTWKSTALEGLLNIEKCSSKRSSNISLHFDGFTSLFLYKRWYRCNVDLTSFGLGTEMIERRHGLSVEEFTVTYDGKKPVLLVSLADRWPATYRWSIDSLVKDYGDCSFKVAQNGDKKVLMRFEDYAQYMMSQHDEDPLYIFDPKFGEIAPGLLDDYEVPEYFKEDLFSFLDVEERPPFRWLVIGPTRSGASWHVDPALTSAWNTLVKGRKRWALYPPGRVPPAVVVHADEEDGDVDVDGPSSLQWWLDVYPMLKAEDKPLECIQVPGETIFVPSGWWHCVLNLEDSVAVTQNFVNSQNLEFVCLDLTPGYRQKSVARAGRLALEQHAIEASCVQSVVDLPVTNSRKTLLDCKHLSWEFSVDFLASCMEDRSDYLLFTTQSGSYIQSQVLRKWLQRLWFEKPDLRDKIWKGACIAFDAETWMDRVVSICKTHGLPAPTEDEQLPVGNGSNPVFLVQGYAIKLCVDENDAEKCIDGLASELQFYSILSETGSEMKHIVPQVVTSGVLYTKNRVHTAVPWNGKDELQDLSQRESERRQDNVHYPLKFYRTRWTQAMMNPLYVNDDESDDNDKSDSDHEDDEPDEDNVDSSKCSIYPYLVTARCKGEDFTCVRSRLKDQQIQEFASSLGKIITDLHTLPLPPMPQNSPSCRKPGCLNENSNAVDRDWICKVPGEWEYFVSLMRKQQHSVKDRLKTWGSVPIHLLSQVEDYLPADPVLLAGVYRVADGGVAQMRPPVWLHMDVNEENILLVLDSPRTDDCGDKDKNDLAEAIKACYILDFGDLALGDPLYELVTIYLDVFRGSPIPFKSFLENYKLLLSRGSIEPLETSRLLDCKRRGNYGLPYQAMYDNSVQPWLILRT